MKMKVVIVWKVGVLFMIEEVDFEGLCVGEVLIEVKVMGICYIDYYMLLGVDLEGIFLVIFGYEGVGVVVDVGFGVGIVRKGDYVILFYMFECCECKFCLLCKINLC